MQSVSSVFRENQNCLDKANCHEDVYVKLLSCVESLRRDIFDTPVLGTVHGREFLALRTFYRGGPVNLWRGTTRMSHASDQEEL